MQQKSDAPSSSFQRIAEHVAGTVLSAVCLGVLAAIVAGLGLVAQLISHRIIVPTNVLVTILFVGFAAGIVLTLLIVAAVSYYGGRSLIRRFPAMFAGAAIGATLGATIDVNKTAGAFKRGATPLRQQAASKPESKDSASEQTISPDLLRRVFNEAPTQSKAGRDGGKDNNEGDV